MLSEDYFNGSRKLEYLKILSRFQNTPVDQAYEDVKKDPVVVVVHGNKDSEVDDNLTRDKCLITPNRDIVPLVVSQVDIQHDTEITLDFTASAQQKTVVTVVNDEAVLESMVNRGSEYIVSKLPKPVYVRVLNGQWSKEMHVDKINLLISNRNRVISRSSYGIGFSKVDGCKRQEVLDYYYNYIVRSSVFVERNKIEPGYDYKYGDIVIEKNSNYHVVPWSPKQTSVKIVKIQQDLFVISGGYNVVKYCNPVFGIDFVMDAHLERGVYIIYDNCIALEKSYERRLSYAQVNKRYMDDAGFRSEIALCRDLNTVTPSYEFYSGGLIFKNNYYGLEKGKVFGVRTEPVLLLDGGKVYFNRGGKRDQVGISTKLLCTGFYRMSSLGMGVWSPLKQILGARPNMTRRMDIDLAEPPRFRIGDLMNKYEFAQVGYLSKDHTSTEVCPKCFRCGCRICGQLPTG